MVWPETLSRTPWLINKSAGGPPFIGALSTRINFDQFKMAECAKYIIAHSYIYRLFNVNKKKWRPKGHFPNQPKMANYARSITRGEPERMGVDGGS